MNTDTHGIVPLLLRASDCAGILGISLRQVWSMHQTGALGPLPVKLGARTLWQRAEIERWVEAGCPHRERWIDIKKIARGKKIFLDANVGQC
jgi:predicted DNA-binding transcriptional regulator AlpA